MIKKFLVSRKAILLIFAVLLVGSGLFVFVKKLPPANELVEQPLARHFVTSWRSFKKITDLPYIFYQFKKSELPTYYLSVDLENISKINEGLPQEYYFSKSELTDEHKIEVKARFLYEDYESDVKIRYRGLKLNHWNSKKKSLRVEFPKNSPFDGHRKLDFIIPEDRAYLSESLSVYRAEKLGLLTPSIDFVNLNINGEDYGVYLVNESWSEEFLENHGRSTAGQIYGSGDLPVKTDYNFLKVESLPLWKTRIERGFLGIEDFNDLALVFSLIENKDEDIFIKNIGNFFDLEKFYNWMIVITLASSEHHGDSGNMDFYFNPVTGKLELIPRDVYIDPPKEALGLWPNSFVSRLLSNPEIRKEAEERIWEYVSNRENLKDDLRFYDELWEKTRRDFFADNTKLRSNGYVKDKIELYRSWVIGNFENVYNQLSESGTLSLDLLDKKGEYVGVETRGSFETFEQVSETVDQFIAKYSFFVKTGESEIRLPSGSYYFNNTVIVPFGLKLVIGAGATIYLNKDVSFVSYSPIEAISGVNYPIEVKRLDPNESWGVFAIMNTERERNKLDYVNFSGGSGAIIHGIYFTGMLAAHNSDIEISNSLFEDAGDDDALNIKGGEFVVKNSTFKNNSFDALDVDYAKGEVVDNTFLGNIGADGDAIDFSFSEVTVRGNQIDECGDKGISVGEKTNIIIENNEVKNCLIGIAVKDSSTAKILDTSLIHNETGISLYRKKQLFGGGEASLSGVVFENNSQDIELDDLSKIFYDK